MATWAEFIVIAEKKLFSALSGCRLCRRLLHNFSIGPACMLGSPDNFFRLFEQGS